MNEYKITDNVFPLKDEVKLGDKIHLTSQVQEIVKCQETGVLMLNIDADQLAVGDLAFIKKIGLTISNPDTDKPVALGVDFKEDSWGHKIKKFFEAEDDDNDSGFFSSSGSSFLGGGYSSGGGSSFSSFGGFGGGSFGGGGASRSF